jgi:hypothetical protein
MPYPFASATGSDACSQLATTPREARRKARLFTSFYRQRGATPTPASEAPGRGGHEVQGECRSDRASAKTVMAKSTTMRLMPGLDRGAGATTYDGKALHGYRRPPQVVGILLEARAFRPTRTARNHLRVLATAGTIPAARVDDALLLRDRDARFLPRL